MSMDFSDMDDNTTYYWTVNAWDGAANSTGFPSQVWSFTILLPPANIPVRITSVPPTTAWVGREYAYNITTVDEDGDHASFSLLAGPPGMSLNPTTGEIRWTPAPADIGHHSISIQVSDGRGSQANQTFTITVLEIPAPPPEKPRCAITSPANNSKASGRITVRGTAANGTLPITIVQVRLDGGQWQTATGLADWSFSLDLSKTRNGRHTIEARSFDGSLYSDTASIQVDVRNPEPATSIGEPPWLLIWLLIVIAAGVGIYLASRRRKGS
jgi:hypothetical protein